MTKVIKDKVQTRATIPQVFVDKHNVTSEHKIEWESKGKNLSGVLIQPQVSEKEDKAICKAISQKEEKVKFGKVTDDMITEDKLSELQEKVKIE